MEIIYEIPGGTHHWFQISRPIDFTSPFIEQTWEGPAMHIQEETDDRIHDHISLSEFE